MKTSLYELTNEFLEVVNQLEDMDLDPEVFNSTLDSLQWPIEQKVENIVKYMKSLEAIAEARKAEAKRLNELAAKDLKQAEWFKNYMADNLNKAGIKNLQAGVFALSFRKGSEVLEVDETNEELYRNLEFIQAHYSGNVLEYQQPKILKANIKKLLKSDPDLKIDGIALVRKPDTLQVK